MQRFEDRVVLVTGAGSGIGEAIAARFDAEGAKVVGTDVDDESLTRVAKRLSERFVPLVSDAGNVSDIAALASQIERDFGRLDVLVNNAGWARFATAEEIEEEDYDAQMAVLLKGPLFLVKYLARLLRQSRNGSVINISSGSALISLPRYCPYGLAKVAIHKLTEDCVIQVPGVRHNTIMPGFIATPILKKAYGEGIIEKLNSTLEQINPVPRVGQPADIANAAAFLASDEAGYVNGANLLVDGGLVRLHPAAMM